MPKISSVSHHENTPIAKLQPGSFVAISHPLLPVTGELVRKTGRSEWLIRLPQAGAGVFVKLGQEYLTHVDDADPEVIEWFNQPSRSCSEKLYQA